MFAQLKKGQLAFNRNTKQQGKVVGIGKTSYAVEIIVAQDKEAGTRTTKIENWVKHDTLPFRGKGKKKEYREQEAVSRFHKAFNYPQASEPTVLSAEDVFKRIVFIQEELIELLVASVDDTGELSNYLDTMDAKRTDAVTKELPKLIERIKSSGNGMTSDDAEELRAQRIVEQADALVDILVFAFGTGDMAGVDLLPMFKVVMDSNMSKLDDNGQPIYNEFGKIQKSKNFVAPEPKLLEEVKKQIQKAQQ